MNGRLADAKQAGLDDDRLEAPELEKVGADEPDGKGVAVVHDRPISPSRWERWRERRMARWDLPPGQKDWRYLVGAAGKVLIVIGLMMFGFVAYQLWGTGIETARAQNKLQREFDQQIAAATAEPGDMT